LALDAEMVAESIGDRFGAGGTQSGRQFVEKIIQVPLAVPHVAPERVQAVLTTVILHVLGRHGVAFSQAEIDELLTMNNVKIEGSAMQPTIYQGDLLLVNKVSYAMGGPKRDDIVAFTSPLPPYFKMIERIIGVPGEVVQVRARRGVWINGRRVRSLSS
jgi:hypothetical protein